MVGHSYRYGRIAAPLLAITLASCGGPPPQGPPSGPPEVGVVQLQPESVALSTELPGRTSPFAVAEVRPQVAGIIRARLFREGSDVRAGQILYRIDPAPYRASYAEADAALDNARANVVTARLKAERYGDLVKANAVSKQDADDAQAAYAQAVAQVKQNAASRLSAGINLDYTMVRAPISGRVGRSSYTQGALVTASQSDALTSIQTLDPIYVDVTQSSDAQLALRRALKSGDRSQGGGFFEVSLRLGDGSVYPLKGKLTAADPTVDQTTGAVTLRAVFPNPDKLLLPGMFVRAILSQGVPRAGLLVPQQAVSRDPQGHATVMIVDGQGKAQLRIIQTAQAVGDKWLVTGGLKPGERLIVEGLQNARPGVPVRAVPAGSAPAPMAGR
jgi:membrane fusion protein (multidrug efflux system)